MVWFLWKYIILKAIIASKWFYGSLFASSLNGTSRSIWDLVLCLWSLCYVVILQLFSRGSEENFTRGRGEFDGAYQDPFSGFNKQNHNPFAEFYRQNDGPFSSKFYKIFSEVIICFSSYPSPRFAFTSTFHYWVPPILFVFRFSSMMWMYMPMTLRFILNLFIFHF